MLKWIETKDGLPNPGKYVIAHYCLKNLEDTYDPNYKILKFVKTESESYFETFNGEKFKLYMIDAWAEFNGFTKTFLK